MLYGFASDICHGPTLGVYFSSMCIRFLDTALDISDDTLDISDDTFDISDDTFDISVCGRARKG